MIQIKKISASDTYPIRLKILREGVPLPYKFEGDLDNDTFHLGAFKNKKLIAVSSYMSTKNNNFKGTQYQLRGMATLKEYQGLGAGKLMLQKAFFILEELKIDFLWCNARIIALTFYKKYGFQIYGQKFEVPYVGLHYVLINKIT